MRNLLKVLLFLIATTVLSNEIKLGEPIKGEFLEKFYGEEETATQEGTYSNVYANYEERYILYDLNLYRLAPQILNNEDVNPDPEVTKCINWGYCFQPTKPLYWNLNLSRAARYHSNDMIVNDCFAHNDCDGGDIWARITRYYSSSAMGENIAAGSNYNEVTKNFINEKGAALGTVGHRENVFTPDFNEVGLGYLKGGSYRVYTTQDFGASASPHFIPAAIHEPQSPIAGSKVKFKAIYHGSSDAPGVWLILNNSIYPMNKNISNHDWKSSDYIGKDSVKDMDWYSIEYITENVIENSCNKYSFLVTIDGAKHRYPDVGSLFVGKDCTESYSNEVVTIDETNFNDPTCESDSCVEQNKTTCNVSNHQITCSCDSGYTLSEGVCKRNSVNSVSEDGCSFSGTNSSYMIFFIGLILFFLSRKKLNNKIS